MRLRHIEIFEAIRRTGSLTQAAAALHITQPAASKLQASAEAQLGFKLFERVTLSKKPKRISHASFFIAPTASQRQYELLTVFVQGNRFPCHNPLVKFLHCFRRHALVEEPEGGSTFVALRIATFGRTRSRAGDARDDAGQTSAYV